MEQVNATRTRLLTLRSQIALAEQGAELLRSKGRFEIVEIGYLELAEPMATFATMESFVSKFLE